MNPVCPALERSREACVAPSLHQDQHPLPQWGPISRWLPRSQSVKTSSLEKQPHQAWTVRSCGALFPQGDDKIFFAIKIPLKLGPKKTQSRKLFERKGPLLCSNYHACIPTGCFLLPPASGSRELPCLGSASAFTEAPPRGGPFPGWSQLFCSLLASIFLPHS